MKTTLIPLTSLLAASAAFAQTVTYDWNTEAQFNSFNAVNENTPVTIAPTYSASGGLGATGSGAFFFDSAGSAGPYSTFTTGDGAVTFDLTQNQTITQSTYFKTGTLTSVNSARPALYLGLTSETSVPVDNNGGSPSVKATGAGLYIDSIGADGTVNAGVGMVSGTSGGNGFGGFAQSQGSFTLASDSWYFMEVSYAYTSSDSAWVPTITISNADALGSVLTPVTGGSVTVSPQKYTDTWSGDTDLRGYLATRGGDSMNIAMIDGTTLVAIPEPSAYGLIAGSLALGWIMMRRRK